MLLLVIAVTPLHYPLCSIVTPLCRIGVLGGLQRSHSNHRQQHIPPLLKIKTFYQGSESERIFSIF